MRLISTSRDELLKPLLTVAGIVERRHTMPILANVLIKKVGTSVFFIATDLEVQISAKAVFDETPEESATTVNTRKLIDVLRALPSVGQVSLSVEKSKLLIQCGKSRFTIQTVSANEFPTLTELTRSDIEINIPSNKLKHLFNMTHYSMAQQDIRYYLNGTLLVFEPTLLHAVGTDAHRLAHCAVEIEGVEEPHDIILPRKTVTELQRMLPDSDDQVRLQVGIGQVRFSFGNVELISKLVEGKFPDYKRVLPTDYVCYFDVEREQLLGSLNRAAILTTNEKLRSVRVQLGDNLMTISSSNADQEAANEELEIDYSFSPLDIGFNVTYLQDFLSSVKSETVRWSVKPETSSSVLLGVPGEDSFQYVVMPMRI
ncbi:DNA polymerase III subunit beta [Orrella marina]|uniref:Beta sliding clamp n=1 Tax=Orrella marina TaxID=2163011 RepID=A0A2R4XLM7_9BURK|nr:DNA polymerase III subunit beta [Orrella marina]AWB34700.1 DNA polymerase III subunit beta [Orrella marina]